MMPKRNPGEKSFTLIETLIALGIMVTLVLQIGIVQGQAIGFSDYGRKMTQGIWLAKAVMSQIEYQSKFIDLKEMKYDQKDQEFNELLCPKTGDFECDYKYNLKIENWKLDLVDLFFRKKKKEGSEDSGEEEENPMMGMIKDQIKEQLGEELISYAHVEVTWPEGSRRNSVDLAYLLTNQLELDRLIETLPALDGGGDGGAKAPSPPAGLPGGLPQEDER